MDESTRTATVNVLGLRYEFEFGKGGNTFFFVFCSSLSSLKSCFCSEVYVALFHMKTSLNENRNFIRHSEHVYWLRTSHSRVPSVLYA